MRVDGWTAGASSPAISGRDYEISPLTLERLDRRAGERVVRLRWSGYLHIDVAGDYTFLLDGVGRTALSLDARPVIAPTLDTTAGGRGGHVTLAAGAHLLVIDYERASRDRILALAWVRGGDGVASRIPASRLSMKPLSERGWRQRQTAVPLVIALAIVWSALLLWMAGRLTLRALDVTPRPDWPLTGLAVVVIGTAIWWGWPGSGWAADELTPDVVRPALDAAFMHGWHDKYPPFHYMLLGVIYAPLLAADAAGAVAAWAPPGFAALAMMGRATSVAMALGVLAIVFAAADRFYGRPAARWAVICCVSFLPFAFFGKLANLEIPYVFWSAAALWCWIRVDDDPRARGFILLGVSAALAVATKDQAYGLLVLPGIIIATRAIARHRRAGVRLIAVAVLAFAAAFALAHNLLLNPSGFVGHVDTVLGPASADYRMFGASATGIAALAGVTASLLTWTVGVPGLLLASAGLVVAPRRTLNVRLWVAVPVLSYLVTFVAVVGYQYDRFLLPVAVLLSVPAGGGADWLLRHLDKRLASLATAAMVALLIWRPLAIDVLMLTDARGTAERWLERAVEPGDTVGSFGQELYLPRLDGFDRRILDGSIADTQKQRPAYIVLNTEYLRRDVHGPLRAAWAAWLIGPDSGYREVFRFKAPVPAPAIGLFGEMRDREETPFSNLDKINPEVLILHLRENPVP